MSHTSNSSPLFKHQIKNTRRAIEYTCVALSAHTYIHMSHMRYTEKFGILPHYVHFWNEWNYVSPCHDAHSPLWTLFVHCFNVFNTLYDGLRSNENNTCLWRSTFFFRQLQEWMVYRKRLISNRYVHVHNFLFCFIIFLYAAFVDDQY